MILQIAGGCGSWLLLQWVGADKVLCEGTLMGFLCPVASSVAVVSCMLGANRQTVTTYAIIGNLMVALVAPLTFTLIGEHGEIGFIHSVWMIARKLGSTLALPFVIAVFLQWLWPKGNAWIAQYRGIAFYLWALALLCTLGQTIHYIHENGTGQWSLIGWMAVLSLTVCIVQFAVGRHLGRRYGDVISGGQLLGQKNSAMGIWMTNTFLSPLASVFIACYSIYQNLFNSWQIWQHERKEKSETRSPHD